MNDTHYTLKEILEKIKTPVAYLRKMIKEEKLEASKMGRDYKCTEKDVQKFIDSLRLLIMSNKELLKALGFDDRTISVTFDENYQRIVEIKVDDYLKKIEEEEKRKKYVDFFKQKYEEHQEKEKFIAMFNEPYVFRKIKNKLILEKFVNDCKFCWGCRLEDLSLYHKSFYFVKIDFINNLCIIIVAKEEIFV